LAEKNGRNGLIREQNQLRVACFFEERKIHPAKEPDAQGETQEA